MVDGSLRISTRIDNSKVDKDIVELENKIKKLQRNSSKNSLEQENLQEEIDKYNELCLKADEYNYRLKQLNLEKQLLFKANPNLAVSVDTPQYSNIKNQIIEMKQKYAEATQEIDKQTPKIEKIRIKLQDVKVQQEENNQKIAKYNKELQETQRRQFDLNYNTEGIGKSINKGITKILRYGAALLSIRSIYGLLSNAMNNWLNGNTKGAKQLKSDIDYMKNAIGQALSPILKYIINLLYQALGFTGALIKAFTGVDIFAGSIANYMASTTSSASKTNKELKKQLTNFDRINKLNSNSNENGSSGGVIAPSQDLSSIMEKYTEQAEKLKEKFEEIKDIVVGIGLAIAGWKIADLLGLTGKQKLGLAIGLSSLYFYFDGIKGLLNGELNAENFTKAFASAAGLGISAGLLTGNWKLALIITIGTMSLAGGISIGEKIKEYCPNSIDWYIDVVNLDWDHDSVVDKIWKSIIIVLGTIGDAIVKWISDTAIKVKDNAKQYFSNAITIVGGFLQSVLLDIIEGIANIVENVPIIGEKLSNAIRSGIKDKRESVNTELKDALGYVTDQNGVVADRKGRIIGDELTTSMIKGIKNNDNNVSITMENSLLQATNKAQSTATQGGNRVGAAQINGIKQGESSQTTALKNNLSSVVSNASSNIDTSSKAQTIGKNIISGIKLGITGNSWSLYSAITSLGSTLLSTFKNAMGIHSPSREMASLAKFIPLGIAEGIDSTSDKAVGSMKNLVADIEDTASNMNVQYNIPKIPRNAISYVPRQAISTNEIQRTIVGQDSSALSSLLDKINLNRSGNIIIYNTIDGEVVSKTIRKIDKKHSFATNGGF